MPVYTGYDDEYKAVEFGNSLHTIIVLDRQ